MLAAQVLQFDNFLSSDEADAFIARGREKGFKRSEDAGAPRESPSARMERMQPAPSARSVRLPSFPPSLPSPDLCGFIRMISVGYKSIL